MSQNDKSVRLDKDQFAMLNASALTAAFFALNAQMTAQNSGVEPDPAEVWDRIAGVREQVYYKLINQS
ncbi:MAG: hypothetical protein AB7S75_16625 [Desulfococcaceae bacterium]